MVQLESNLFLGFGNIVDLLIQKGAEINSSNNRGDTALMLAALNGNSNCPCFATETEKKCYDYERPKNKEGKRDKFDHVQLFKMYYCALNMFWYRRTP